MSNATEAGLLGDYKPSIALSELRDLWRAAIVHIVYSQQDDIDNWRKEVSKHFRRYVASACVSDMQDELRRRQSTIDQLRAENRRLAQQLSASVDEVMHHQDRARVFGESNARLKTELEAARTQGWQPVANGAYHTRGNDIVVEGHLLGIAEHGKPIYAGALPDEIRLCRLVASDVRPVEAVPDGIYGQVDTITISRNGTMLEINSACGDGSAKHNAIIPLPDGWQLMRPVAKAQE